jgi:hypothetical protein
MKLETAKDRIRQGAAMERGAEPFAEYSFIQAICTVLLDLTSDEDKQPGLLEQALNYDPAPLLEALTTPDTIEELREMGLQQGAGIPVRPDVEIDGDEPEQLWARIGASEYAIEWSDDKTTEGHVQRRHFEVLRRATGGIKVLPTKIQTEIGPHDDQSSEDAMWIGSTGGGAWLSVDDARALKLALAAAIDHAERTLAEIDGSTDRTTEGA